MSTYFFMSPTITEAQVQTIVSTAGYIIGNYTYAQMVAKDGYVVQGSPVMNINRLESAAKAKKIKVEISSPPGLPMVGVEGGTAYQVTITMDATTVSTLLSGNFVLYGFKAVQSTAAGSPLVSRPSPFRPPPWWAGPSSTRPTPRPAPSFRTVRSSPPSRRISLWASR